MSGDLILSNKHLGKWGCQQYKVCEARDDDFSRRGVWDSSWQVQLIDFALMI
jgi:hypothetical protein